MIVHALALVRVSKIADDIVKARVVEADASKLSDVQEGLGAFVAADDYKLAVSDCKTDADKELALAAAKRIVLADKASDDARQIAVAAAKRIQSLQDIHAGYELTSQTKYVNRLNKLTVEDQTKIHDIASALRRASHLSDAKSRKEETLKLRAQIRELAIKAGVDADKVLAAQ